MRFHREALEVLGLVRGPREPLLERVVVEVLARDDAPHFIARVDDDQMSQTERAEDAVRPLDGRAVLDRHRAGVGIRSQVEPAPPIRLRDI